MGPAVVQACGTEEAAAPLVPSAPTRVRRSRRARDVKQREAELGVFFDTIVVCTVTGSTHAGMIAGFALYAHLGGQPALDAYAGAFS